jgi:putative addiction module component (TIGR02574 family)
MSFNLESLGIQQLSVPERLELIEKIWDSLPDTVSADELPDWHRAEIARRRAEEEAHPGLGKPWREALGAIEAGQ